MVTLEQVQAFAKGGSARISGKEYVVIHCTY